MRIRSVLRQAPAGLVLALALTGCAAKGITGSEWITKRHETIPLLESLSREMDDVVSSYVTGLYMPEDYADQVLLLRQEYNVAFQSLKEYKIKPGSLSEDEAKAKAAYEKIWEDISALIDRIGMEDCVYDMNLLTYQYMAYTNEIKNDYSIYLEEYKKINPDEEDEG